MKEKQKVKMTTRFWHEDLEEWNCHLLSKDKGRNLGGEGIRSFGHVEFAISSWNPRGDVE